MPTHDKASPSREHEALPKGVSDEGFSLPNIGLIVRARTPPPDKGLRDMGLLKNGSKGDDVTQLQNDLNTLGFTIGTDGMFGPNTVSAIEQLQWMFGYSVDGMVGNGTQGLISSQVKNSWNAGTRDGIVNALKAQGKTAESGAVEGIELKRTLKSSIEGSDVAYTPVLKPPSKNCRLHLATTSTAWSDPGPTSSSTHSSATAGARAKPPPSKGLQRRVGSERGAAHESTRMRLFLRRRTSAPE
jgi:peptidoglycan hydrolase-like protein with peptidoglycan-binding domain